MYYCALEYADPAETERGDRLEETMRSMRDLWPEAPSIVILTGAGISRESGLATFRDADGIWATVRLEEVATPEAFVRDPARVLRSSRYP